ncbi:uncharacterized protein LOC121371979 isoform X2 [Gigantopelta aegis]|uniref:uncharacterized protein LOC121371979 isoform X2 n=1 Tax=Gigantopelta aegis TaxID=1735272 RepID=UPI001B88E019|nr:uncharacterized protein LOC121371979 isoform X2 [Gigantopelta aegis]
MDMNSNECGNQGDVYEAGAVWCETKNKLEMAVKVLESGINKYPDTITLKTKLLEVFRAQKDYPGIVYLTKQLAVLIPDNTALFLIGADAATNCHELELAREWCIKVIESDNVNFAEKAKQILSFVESKLAETTEKKSQDESTGQN